MKTFHTFSVFLLLCSLGLFSPTSKADLQRGIDAANVGDFEVAVREFKYLAENNYAPGQYHLAELYERGLGVPKNVYRAAELYKKAAEQDYVDAMFSLAVMYQEGIGVKQDLSTAVSWFTKAAEKGLAAAQFNLGVMYSNGIGVVQDYITAMDWYMKAAAQNYTLAQFNMALMYFHGHGTAKSLEKSYIWNTIAEYNGNDDASKSRKLDERNMSPSQIKAAKEKADEIYSRILAGKYYGDNRI